MSTNNAIKPIFVAEDFETDALIYPVRARLAEIANARLAELIATWPVVYGGYVMGCLSWDTDGHDTDTHTARLAFVTEIKPKVCSHEIMSGMHTIGETYNCVDCGAKLKARWELAE